jgi:signal transduction histidine kinase
MLIRVSPQGRIGTGGMLVLGWTTSAPCWAYGGWMRRPVLLDVATGVGLVVIGLMELSFETEGTASGRGWVELVGLCVVGACAVLRRSRATAGALAIVTAVAVVSLLVTDSRAWVIAAVMLAQYSGARHSDRRWQQLLVLASGVGYGFVVSALEESDSLLMYLGNFVFYLVLMVLVPWSAGAALQWRQWRSLLEAERATEAERLRIARELHDIVGHALGAIVAQAEGERATLPRAATDSTRETLEAVAGTARDALDDVRRLLRVMRTVEDRGTPAPGLADVPRLLHAMEAAGLPVSVAVEGQVRPLPAGVDLSAYRVVQEALTNCLKHAGGAPAEVVLHYSGDAVDIDVRDAGLSVADRGRSGYGLLGMRERVAVFDGTVEARPRPGGGFSVHVHLPTTTPRGTPA